jgi:hypothetical protein
VQAGGLDGPDAVAPNVITVGSTANRSAANVLTTAVSPEQLVESAFSDANPDVKAIGEQILNDPTFNGTSLSAPQVTGLASYLWLLSPELRDLPPAMTKRAIQDNTRNNVIDAYAAALSLDGAGLPTAPTAPVRLALLDTDSNDLFTEVDIEAFLRHLYFVDPVSHTITNAPPSATDADFSRYDLNGDGFTTSGSRREQFDLDRVGSIQFGHAKLSKVTQDIEGQDVTFDETALTDIEILCYYAYSDLYQGNHDLRKTLLAGRCGLSIDPKTATLRSGQTLQFTATSPGSGAFVWSASAGTVSNTGLYTAAAPGTATVRATSVANPAVFAEATVTITSGRSVRLVSRSCGTSVTMFEPNFVTTEIGAKVCDPIVRRVTPPYTVPDVTINGTVADQFTYLADYHETFSEAELLSDSVSSGGITIHDHVSSVKVPAGQTPPTFGVLDAGTNYLFEFDLLEGTHRVTIQGQVSLTVPKFQIPARAFVLALIEGEPVLPRCSLTQAVVDLRTCQLRPLEQDLFFAGFAPGTVYSQKFSFTADVNKGQRLAINVGTTAAGVLTTTLAGDNDAQVSLNVTFDRIQ